MSVEKRAGWETLFNKRDEIRTQTASVLWILMLKRMIWAVVAFGVGDSLGLQLRNLVVTGVC